MPINIGANFAYNGKLPNFDRDKFVTKAAMKVFPETSIDDGHLSYCEEDGNMYQFKSSNAVDGTTGKWRLFKTGTDVDLSAYATKDSVAVDLDKKVDIKGVGKSTGSAQLPVIKVMTINIPVNYRYRTGFFRITLMCDNEQFTRALITINTLPEDYVIKVVESSIHPKSNENLYYLYDKINNKVELYQTLLRKDNLSAKVTDQDADSSFTWNLDMSIVDALPEGAIKVNDVNYGNKNLFYATPKNAAGDPKFRAIDITDLPDLSSKYATKDKAFTTDNVSAEPNQFVAGPATTKGNLSLRKIEVSDLPDLSKKYQKLDQNGWQSNPIINSPVILSNNGKFLTAAVPVDVTGRPSPDWYYATDGSLQDITASYYNKTYLDDKFRVISASLNDLASSSGNTYNDTEVRQLISNNTSAIATKADKSELAKYQPMYRADYVANKDIDYSELPSDATSVDLNGYTLSVTGVVTISNRQFYNGIVKLSVDGVVSKDNYYNNVDIHTYPTLVYTYNENGSNYWNCNIQKANIIAGTTLHYCDVRDSVIASTLDSCFFTGFVRCTFNTNGLVGHAVTIDDKLYLQCVIKDNNPTEADFESDIDNPVIKGNAPSCDAVKTKLANYVPKTSASNIDIIAPGVTIGPDATSKAVKVSSSLVQFNIDGNMISLSQANGINFQTAVGKKVTIGGCEVATMDVINAMPKTVFITQTAYDALSPKDANTIYYING